MGNQNHISPFISENGLIYGLPSDTQTSFCVCDEQTKIIDVSNAFCILFKCEKEDYIGKLLSKRPKKQQQLGLSSKMAIKKIQKILQSFQGNYQTQWEFQRFTNENFFAKVQICCGLLNKEKAFRVIIQEIENPIYQPYVQQPRQLPDLISPFIQQHNQQIQGYLWKSSLRGSESEKEILYNLYSLSENYKDSIRNLQNQLKIEKYRSEFFSYQTLDEMDINYLNNNEQLVNQEYSFDIMTLDQERKQKKLE